MPQLQTGLVDGAELNFNQSFLKFNEKKRKKYRQRVILDLTSNFEY